MGLLDVEEERPVFQANTRFLYYFIFQSRNVQNTEAKLGNFDKIAVESPIFKFPNRDFPLFQIIHGRGEFLEAYDYWCVLFVFSIS